MILGSGGLGKGIVRVGVGGRVCSVVGGGGERCDGLGTCIGIDGDELTDESGDVSDGGLCRECGSGSRFTGEDAGGGIAESSPS